MKNKTMDIFEKKKKYNHLFDYYGPLLTDKQQSYFTYYHFEDLSLAEIADIYKVSRNAVYDQLNKIYALLDHYEDKLGLSKKDIQLEQILSTYQDSKNLEVQELINKLRNME